MKKIYRFSAVFLILFFFSCAQNVEIVKYKNFYNFNSFLKLKVLEFKPFPDNIAFKTKNTLIFLNNNKKYTFYSVIYSYGNYCRIFCYALFGKRVVDLLFVRDKIFLVPSKGKNVFIVDVNKKFLTESIFNFLKDVVKGIELNNAYAENECYYGFYNGFEGRVCKKEGFRRLILKKGLQKREINIYEVKNGFSHRIELNLGEKILKIEVKNILKPKKNPEKMFLKSIKNYKRVYIKNLLQFEKSVFMEKSNENK